MKTILLALLSLVIMSCASNQHRDPASAETNNPMDVRQGLNTDSYGISNR